MRSIKVLGLMLVAVFAMSAVAASSAAAAELEFTVHPNKITKATQSGEGELETKAGRDVKCTGGSTTGEITGAKSLTAKAVKFTGCKSTKFGGGSCQSGATKGEIVTKELEGELVYPKGTKGKHTEAAVDLKPKGGGNFVTFTCETLIGTETLTTKGSVICKIEPINVKSKKSTLRCVRSATKGVQAITEYETEAGVVTKDILETEGKGPEEFAFEQSSQSSVSEQEVEKEMEIKA